MSPLDIGEAPLRCVVFDSCAGGSGVINIAMTQLKSVAEAALHLVEDCSTNCVAGCPFCIHHSACRQSNIVLDKFATISILRAIMLILKT